MRTKYKTVFISRNEEDRTFDLTFEILAEKRMHVVTDVQVYDRKRDAYLELYPINQGETWRGELKSFFDYLKFNINITPTSTGVSFSVIEHVITIIHSEDNLQPCN